MTAAPYENERMQSVHLSILVIMTLSAAALTLEAFLPGWELWMPPLLLAGVIVSWIVYVQQIFTERGRLYLYAIVIWALVIYHAVPDAERERFAKVKACTASSDWNAPKTLLADDRKEGIAVCSE